MIDLSNLVNMDASKLTFTESFFGYRFNNKGFHDGKTLITTPTALQNYLVRNNTYPEIRITDMMDMLVMHVVKGKLIYPTEEDLAKTETPRTTL